MKTKHVVVKLYDPSWEDAFNDIKNYLLPAIKNDVLSIEHVGSTSVKGLAAKPVIDIDIVIDSMAVFDSLKQTLAKHGYMHEGDLGIPGREAFKYTTSSFMKHHLYVCPKDSQALKEHRFFKDFLQTHPDIKDQYGKIKLAASQKYPADIDLYIKAKDPFIKNILSKMEDNDEKRILL